MEQTEGVGGGGQWRTLMMGQKSNAHGLKMNADDCWPIIKEKTWTRATGLRAATVQRRLET